MAPWPPRFASAIGRKDNKRERLEEREEVYKVRFNVHISTVRN